MPLQAHLLLARRLLKAFPKVVNDIYMSEEYYGENALHFSIVAEDPIMVKFFLDEGVDIHRRCYGAFFCPDDQKPHRRDRLDLEEVLVPLRTNYKGYVAWGEYPLCFAAVLNQVQSPRIMP